MAFFKSGMEDEVSERVPEMETYEGKKKPKPRAKKNPIKEPLSKSEHEDKVVEIYKDTLSKNVRDLCNKVRALESRLDEPKTDTELANHIKTLGNNIRDTQDNLIAIKTIKSEIKELFKVGRLNGVNVHRLESLIELHEQNHIEPLDMSQASLVPEDVVKIKLTLSYREFLEWFKTQKGRSYRGYLRQLKNYGKETDIFYVYQILQDFLSSGP